MKLKQSSDVTRSHRAKTTQFLKPHYLINWALFFLMKNFLVGVYAAEVQAMLNPGLTVAKLPADSEQISQGFDDLMAAVEAIEVSSLPNQERQNITVNPEQTYQAFTICEPPG
jgi:hypothetical protein